MSTGWYLGCNGEAFLLGSNWPTELMLQWTIAFLPFGNCLQTTQWVCYHKLYGWIYRIGNMDTYIF